MLFIEEVLWQSLTHATHLPQTGESWFLKGYHDFLAFCIRVGRGGHKSVRSSGCDFHHWWFVLCTRMGKLAWQWNLITRANSRRMCIQATEENVYIAFNSVLHVPKTQQQEFIRKHSCALNFMLTGDWICSLWGPEDDSIQSKHVAHISIVVDIWINCCVRLLHLVPILLMCITTQCPTDHGKNSTRKDCKIYRVHLCANSEQRITMTC